MWQDEVFVGSEKSLWSFPLASYSGQTVEATTGTLSSELGLPNIHNPDYYLGAYVVSSGDVDLGPILVSNITIGLGYTQTIETMPIEVKDQNGVTTGMPKRIVSADIYMASTLAVQLQGNKVLTFNGEDDLTVKPTPITGARKFYLLGYSERPTLTIENSVPVPCEVLSVGGEVEY